MASTSKSAEVAGAAPVFYAHTLGDAVANWEPLADHLHLVSDRAASFAGAFGADTWGRAAGIWHDVGKYSAAFQNYLRGEVASEYGLDGASAETLPGRVDHSTAGAQHALRRDPLVGRLLAYAIAGHHAGLADRGAVEVPGTLEARLAKTDGAIADALRRAPAEILDAAVPKRPPIGLAPDPSNAAFQVAFFTRMVFSALVDADFLSTEAFLDPTRRDARTATPDLHPLAAAVAHAIDAKTEHARRQAAPERVSECRRTVAEDCAAASARPPGFFTLTVPTGGGKTLASMRFALDHAYRHGLRRVIVAVPFTSIIDQNARVYQEALGGSHVLEHHSNLDPARENRWRALTSENWDAAVVVTTTVQLFESLFSARPSDCRKLHNVARSVIVLDEAQAVPVTLLRPILAALRELVSSYGCSVVLCTATQPALGVRAGFPIGLPLGPRCEIIRDVPALFTGLRRTRVRTVGTRSDSQIVDRVLGAAAALVIVNTRRHAAALFGRLQDRDRSALHLSASMCPVHRAMLLAEVRRRLDAGEPCRLVSTQVVEAGVDVDFPLVLRSMAGLDSIAQSAGRCNREGRLEVGEVEVFAPSPDSEGRVPSAIAHARDAARQVLPDHADDPVGPASIEAFFGQHYWKQSARWDAAEVMECFNLGPAPKDGLPILDLNFRTAAERFVMIDQAQRGVVVPYGTDGPGLVARLLRGHPPTREMWAQLQRHSVSLPASVLDRMLAGGIVAESEPGPFVLVDPAAYSPDTGLLQDRSNPSPELLCC